MPAPLDLRKLINDAWNAVETERRLDAMDRFFTEDYVRHSSEGDYTRDGFRDVLAALHAGFPDLVSTTEDTVVEGDRIAYRWTSEGTHLGEYMGIPATKKRVTARGITISRIAPDGRIAEDWASWNKVSVLHALGVIPIG